MMIRDELNGRQQMLGPVVMDSAQDQMAADELFEVVKSGAVKIEINQTYKLRDAVQAHRDLESRKTTGCTILTL